PGPALLPDDAAVAEAVHRLEERAEGGPERARARAPGHVAPEEVADRHPGGVAARLAQGERRGEVAGHVVVSERGEQGGPPRRRHRAVPLEDPLDEPWLARAGDVVGTGLVRFDHDPLLQRGCGATGAYEHFVEMAGPLHR